MTGTGPYANASSWMGLAIETTRGTAAAAPSVFVPVKSPKIQPVLTTVDNDSVIGSMVQVIDQITTVRHDEYTFTCMAYLDTLPHLLRGLLGSPDTLVGTASPYTHTLSLLNNDPTNGNQPPSYTFFDYDGFTLRTMAGGQVDEIGIKFTATGLVELTVKVQTMPYVAGGSVPSTAFSTVSAAPSWSCTASVNSVSTVPIVDGTLSFKRAVKALHTLGQQSPYRLFAGPLDASGGQLTIIHKDDSVQNLGLAGTAFPLVLTFNPPANAGQSFAFQMSTVKASQTHQERGGDGVMITQIDLKALPNATDATTAGGGVSAVKVTIVNSQSVAY